MVENGPFQKPKRTIVCQQGLRNWTTIGSLGRLRCHINVACHISPSFQPSVLRRTTDFRFQPRHKSAPSDLGVLDNCPSRCRSSFVVLTSCNHISFSESQSLQLLEPVHFQIIPQFKSVRHLRLIIPATLLAPTMTLFRPEYHLTSSGLREALKNPAGAQYATTLGSKRD